MPFAWLSSSLEKVLTAAASMPPGVAASRTLMDDLTALGVRFVGTSGGPQLLGWSLSPSPTMAPVAVSAPAQEPAACQAGPPLALSSGSSRRLQDLEDGVYAAPHDIGPRAVYGDALLEAGDPRGELIALQLARRPRRAPSERELELLARHGQSWAGPLAALAAPGSLRFTAGFLSGLEIIRHQGLPRLLTAREWSTLRGLDIGALRWASQPLAQRLLTEAPLGALRRLWNMPMVLAQRLARAGVRSSACTVGLCQSFHQRDVQWSLSAFPELETLVMPAHSFDTTVADEIARAMGRPGRVLASLQLTGSHVPAFIQLPRLWGLFARRPWPVANVVQLMRHATKRRVHRWEPAATLRWVGSHLRRVVVRWPERPRRPELRALVAALEQLPADALWELNLGDPEQRHFREAGLGARLNRALRRQRDLRRLEP